MRHFCTLLICMCVALAAHPVFASKATELYIPFGESPGLSGEVTFVGRVTRVNTASATLTVAGSSGTRTLRVDKHSRIYLDSSWVECTNDYGTMDDITIGDMVEVMFEKTSRERSTEWADMRTAEWVKVKRGGR